MWCSTDVLIPVYILLNLVVARPPPAGTNQASSGLTRIPPKSFSLEPNLPCQDDSTGDSRPPAPEIPYSRYPFFSLPLPILGPSRGPLMRTSTTPVNTPSPPNNRRCDLGTHYPTKRYVEAYVVLEVLTCNPAL